VIIHLSSCGEGSRFSEVKSKGEERRVRLAGDCNPWMPKMLTGNSQSLLRLSCISAHKVRALATSWAMYKGVTLQEIMQAVEWKSHTVFSQFHRFRKILILY
jgi:hypothetical protein